MLRFRPASGWSTIGLAADNTVNQGDGNASYPVPVWIWWDKWDKWDTST